MSKDDFGMFCGSLNRFITDRFMVVLTIRNKNTRTAYLHAAGRFFAWCEHHQLGHLADTEPLHVAAYIEALG